MSAYLIDTCVLVWLDSALPKVSPAAIQVLEDPESTCMMSAISIWEMEVKVRLGKLRLSSTVEKYVASLESAYDLQSLSLEGNACFQLSKLPNVHADPFDRMLVCQAIAASAILVTPDPVLHRYPIQSLW